MLNPLVFWVIGRVARRHDASEGDTPAAAARAEPAPGHVILIGHGRVGSQVAAALTGGKRPLTVIETQSDTAALEPSVTRVTGNAADAAVLRRARIEDARLLFVAIPDAFEAGQIVEQARAMNPALRIVARAHEDAAVDHLTRLGADLAIMGEREIARRMIDQALSAT
jgi:CPA2 family monovalent cation:H+ antiporter-2